MQLFGYWRSSAAYRVRIALHLKALDFSNHSVHLVRDGGEHRKPAYQEQNPQGLVPLLVDGDFRVSQSLAIIEYLEEKHPQPALLPRDLQTRAQLRSWAQFLACELHPLNNLRVLQYLTGPLGLDEDQKMTWYHHWLQQGLAALETQVSQSPLLKATDFTLGDLPGLFEACLVPQLYNARRFQCPLDPYPTLVALDQRCQQLPAFQQAAPEAQPDAQV
ncbi:maleylacetoacetate isomerase [Marinospirillum celere]|uniref:Maleylacetoacetate isomerase n=1 Tax=Marinospirillum celere TaxID=1122252 RepID=A0A1I1FNV8_9GAMM|nr:maleylacetoacetate isomerase [Marinospirillum celere]SFC00971.1 maleylacetoacetate isomerase [Marinospirillum celere]